MIEHWQKTKDPETFGKLMIRWNPVVTKFTNQYGQSGVSKNAVNAQARTQLIKSMSTYNSNAGTQPITHIYNGMKKLNRTANESLTSGHIPEARSIQMATYRSSVDNMADRFGRDPNIDEIADELGWDKKEVVRMNSELNGETTASNAEFDFYGNAVSMTSEDKMLADYMYQELDGKDKLIFEHTFGYGGKPILNNKELASKAGTNEMAINRAKKSMSNRLRSYR